MRFLALVTAGLAALADAYTQPTGPLKGNPIYTPSLNQIVHKGSPFKITWKPTTQGTVTLVLLRGPSTNVQPLYAIAQKIPNNGHHLWTPKLNLEVDTTHYGLQLIVDHNGQYQYSTQFGIGKVQNNGAVGSIGELHIDSFDEAPPTYTTEVVTEYTTYCPSATTIPMGNTTYTVTEATSLTITKCPCTITHTSPAAPTYVPPMNTTSHGPYPTYAPSGNHTVPVGPTSSKHTVSIGSTTTHHTIATTPSTTKTSVTPVSSSPAPSESAPGEAAGAKIGMSVMAAAVGLMVAVVGL